MAYTRRPMTRRPATRFRRRAGSSKVSNYRKRYVRRPRYQGGYSRFGKISQPELKSVTTRENLTFSPGNTQETWTLPPGVQNIPQGTNSTSRIGNCINGKFLTCKLVVKGLDNSSTGPTRGQMMRYIVWEAKSDLAGATPNAYIGTQNLTSFLNTREIRVVKHGMVALSNISACRYIALHLNMKNKVYNFEGNTTNVVNSHQRQYITLISDSEAISVDNQSRFWFADP